MEQASMEKIAEKMAQYGETLDDKIHSVGGYGECGFTLWTKTRVYFWVRNDLRVYVASVPRNPCEIKVCIAPDWSGGDNECPDKE